MSCHISIYLLHDSLHILCSNNYGFTYITYIIGVIYYRQYHITGCSARELQGGCQASVRGQCNASVQPPRCEEAAKPPSNRAPAARKRAAGGCKGAGGGRAGDERSRAGDERRWEMRGGGRERRGGERGEEARHLRDCSKQCSCPALAQPPACTPRSSRLYHTCSTSSSLYYTCMSV